MPKRGGPRRSRDHLIAALITHVIRIRQQNHVRFAHGLDQRLVRLLAGPRFAAGTTDLESNVVLFLGKSKVNGDDPRGSAIQISNQVGERESWPGPATIEKGQIADTGVIDLDEHYLGICRRAIRGELRPPVVRRHLRAIEPASRADRQNHGS